MAAWPASLLQIGGFLWVLLGFGVSVVFLLMFEFGTFVLALFGFLGSGLSGRVFWFWVVPRCCC